MKERKRVASSFLSFRREIRGKQPVFGFEAEELGGRRLMRGGSALYDRGVEPFLPQFHPIQVPFQCRDLLGFCPAEVLLGVEPANGPVMVVFDAT